MTKKIKLNVTGMHCASCAMQIEYALEEIPGVVSSKIDYVRESGEVEIDPEKAKTESVIAAIAKLGYDAKLAED